MVDVNQEFADFIKNSELAQEFKRKQRKDLEVMRAAAIDARTPCEKELESVSSRIADIKNNHIAALKGLDEQRKALEGITEDQLLPLRSRSRGLEREINTRNSFLLENYESDIRDGLFFFQQKLSEALATQPSRTFTTGDKKLSGEVEIISYSNRPAVLNCAEYCRAAIVELEAMRLNSAGCDAERIETLKRDIPDMRKVSESSGWMKSARAARELLGT
jgi:hypothetical protein